MRRRRLGRVVALMGLAAWCWGASSDVAWAQTVVNGTSAPGGVVAMNGLGAPVGASCASCTKGSCQVTHCPPHFHHCMERPPVICIKCGCPRPVCNPCALPNFGYFQTCWTPWPLPPDWSHCPVPPPAAYVQLGTPNMAVPGTPNLLPTVPHGPSVAPNGEPGATSPGEPEMFPQPRPLAPGAGSKLR